jgi:hypothetical protein
MGRTLAMPSVHAATLAAHAGRFRIARVRAERVAMQGIHKASRTSMQPPLAHMQ